MSGCLEASVQALMPYSRPVEVTFDVHRGFLGAGAGAVYADVVGQGRLVLVLVHAFVGRDESASALVGLHVIGPLGVLVVLVAVGVVGFFLLEPLVEGLTVVFFCCGVAVPVAGGDVVGRGVPLVEDVIDSAVNQGVF